MKRHVSSSLSKFLPLQPALLGLLLHQALLLLLCSGQELPQVLGFLLRQSQGGLGHLQPAERKEPAPPQPHLSLAKAPVLTLARPLFTPANALLFQEGFQGYRAIPHPYFVRGNSRGFLPVAPFSVPEARL